MSNYCDFNPGLFRPFVSMKRDIVPAMADDWVMVPVSYTRVDGFSLKSEKLGQQVADIDLRRFLQFCAEQNLVIDSLRLQGNYIIGNDRSVYTEEMFNTWKAKFDKRTETILDVNTCIPGHRYKTPCGKTVIYMGWRYVSRIQFPTKGEKLSFDKYSQVSKIHFTADSLIREAWDKTYEIESMKVKFTEDKGEEVTLEKVDEIMDHFYRYSPEFVVFSKERPAKDHKIGLIEVPLPHDLGKDKYNYMPVLVMGAKDKLYCGDGYNGPTLEMAYRTEKMRFGLYCQVSHFFDVPTLSKGGSTNSRGYYLSTYEKPYIEVEKLYRIGIVAD